MESSGAAARNGRLLFAERRVLAGLRLPRRPRIGQQRRRQNAHRHADEGQWLLIGQLVLLRLGLGLFIHLYLYSSSIASFIASSIAFRPRKMDQ